MAGDGSQGIRESGGTESLGIHGTISDIRSGKSARGGRGAAFVAVFKGAGTGFSVELAANLFTDTRCRLCPVLCPPPNPTKCYRVSAHRTKYTKSWHL